MMDYNNIRMISEGDTVRFTLIKEGEHMLYVFGVNPSTATDQKPDPTMRKVVKFAKTNGFDGFAMMNLYPLRSTNPNALPKIMSEDLHQKNLAMIKKVIGKKDNPVILLAYGNSIDAAPYLKRCLRDIIIMLQPLHPQWKQIGNLTKSGYPRHPSRASYSLKLQDCDITSFLK